MKKWPPSNPIATLLFGSPNFPQPQPAAPGRGLFVGRIVFELRQQQLKAPLQTQGLGAIQEVVHEGGVQLAKWKRSQEEKGKGWEDWVWAKDPWNREVVRGSSSRPSKSAV